MSPSAAVGGGWTVDVGSSVPVADNGEFSKFTVSSKLRGGNGAVGGFGDGAGWLVTTSGSPLHPKVSQMWATDDMLLLV